MEIPKATPQHEWLLKLVGEWRVESDVPGENGAPPTRLFGQESVRKIGDLWIIAESTGEMPGGGMAHNLMTLGFDPETGRYPGTWIGSMMTFLWRYDGEMDPSGKVLTLHCEGPFFDKIGGLTKYRDVITMIDENHRTLTGHFLNREGQWVQMMEAHYYRN